SRKTRALKKDRAANSRPPDGQDYGELPKHGDDLASRPGGCRGGCGDGSPDKPLSRGVEKDLRRQQPLRRDDVLGHLRLQRLDLAKLLLRPDEAVEFDPHRPAVEVAREVEQEDFELHRGLVEGGPDAEAGHAIAGLPVDDGPHGIDAEFRDLEIAQGDIRGRETQLPATLVAMLDSPDDFPGPAENAVGAGNIARLQQPA